MSRGKENKTKEIRTVHETRYKKKRKRMIKGEGGKSKHRKETENIR